MKKYSASALAIAAAVFFSAPASAADLGQNSSLKDEPSYATAGPVVSWTGAYFGVQGGYGNANHDIHAYSTEKFPASPSTCSASISQSETREGGIGDGDTRPHEVTVSAGVSVTNVTKQECYELFEKVPSTAKVNFTDAHDAFTSAAHQFIDGLNSHGFIGGGRIGYDRAFGRYLIGVFGGYDFSNMETMASIDGLGTLKLEKENEWTVGARAGVIVAPRTLVYGLAGYTQTEYKFSGAGGGFSQDFDGITAGGGIEFALSDKVFMGLEYTHTFYGKETLIDVSDELGSLKVTDKLDEDKIMATLKIKLNGIGN